MDPFLAILLSQGVGLASDFLRNAFTDRFSGAGTYMNIARAMSNNFPYMTTQSLVNPMGYTGSQAAVSAQTALGNLRNSPEAIIAAAAQRRLAGQAMQMPTVATEQARKATSQMMGAASRTLRDSIFQSPGARASIASSLNEMLTNALRDVSRTSYEATSKALDQSGALRESAYNITANDLMNQFRTRVEPYLASPVNYQGLLHQENFRAPDELFSGTRALLGDTANFIRGLGSTEIIKSLYSNDVKKLLGID